MRRLTLLLLAGLTACAACGLAGAAPTHASPECKELNFVFLHGAGATVCSLQLLSDCIEGQLPRYLDRYAAANGGATLCVDTLRRCYPNNVDINTWAQNVAGAIHEYFSDKDNLVLIGHSMGGKVALYMAANDVGGLADNVAAVVTINSPVRTLQGYYVAGGGSVLDYCRARWLLSDAGLCDSVAYYDSSKDGGWVAAHGHWLALVSAEAAPASIEFDPAGVDGLPRDMDDGIIPISAQYTEEADVVYYGEYGHSEFTTSQQVADSIAEEILRYLFGDPVVCSVFVRGGSFQRSAGWLPTTDRWDDVVGEVVLDSGTIVHQNTRYAGSTGWQDVVGECSPDAQRSSFTVRLVDSMPLLTAMTESAWLKTEDSGDCRLRIDTRAAPRHRVQVQWAVAGKGLLIDGTERQRYEVCLTTGTPLTAISGISWLSDNPRDVRLRVRSEAEGPFRWFRAEWGVFSKESRRKNIIEQLS